jgi:acid phosphatase class B
MDNEPRLIIIPVNGFCNRIRAIVSAKIIADDLNIPLYIKWIPEIKICNCVYNDVFGDNSNLWNITYEDTGTFKSGLTINNNICMLKGAQRGEQYYITNFYENNCSKKIIKSGGNFYYTKKYNKDQFNNKKNENYKLIKFNDIIYEKYKECNKKFPENYIGVHIRAQDFHFKKRSKNFNIDLFEQNILKCVNNNNMNNILLLGDTKDLINKFKNQLIKHNLNIFTTNDIDSDRDNYVGLQLAIVDFLLLSNSKYLFLTTRSSFGNEAHIFNLDKIEQVNIIPYN